MPLLTRVGRVSERVRWLKPVFGWACMRVIWLEVGHVELYAGQPLAADVQHALKAAEFALEWERKGGSPRGPVVGGQLSPVAAIDFGTK